MLEQPVSLQPQKKSVALPLTQGQDLLIALETYHLSGSELCYFSSEGTFYFAPVQATVQKKYQGFLASGPQVDPNG